MRQRFFLIPIFLFLYSSTAIAQRTTLQEASPKDHSGWIMMPPLEANYVWDIYFLNSKIGWYHGRRMVGQDSVELGLWKSNDAGVSWTFVAKSPHFRKINFFDEIEGYGLPFDAGTIFRTTDGGLSWIPTASSVSRLRDFTFRDGLGLCVGGSGNAGRSEDLIEWHETQYFGEGAVDLNSVTFITERHVVAVGDVHGWPLHPGEYLPSTVVVTSSDAGLTWKRENTQGQEWSFNNVVAIDSLSVLAIAGGGLPTRSTNRGKKWKAAELPDTLTRFGFQDVVFPDPSHGVIVGGEGRILRSDDSGKTWFMQHSGTIKDLITVHMFDSLNGIIMGQDGVYLRTTNGGFASIALPNSAAPLLIKTFPEPFSSSVKLRYTLDKPSPVTITIYSISGEKMREIVLDKQLAGENTVTIDAAGWSAGVYLYTLQACDHTACGRITLVPQP